MNSRILFIKSNNKLQFDFEIPKQFKNYYNTPNSFITQEQFIECINNEFKKKGLSKHLSYKITYIWNLFMCKLYNHNINESIEIHILNNFKMPIYISISPNIKAQYHIFNINDRIYFNDFNPTQLLTNNLFNFVSFNEDKYKLIYHKLNKISNFLKPTIEYDNQVLGC
jgi:hypothetical protein